MAWHHPAPVTTSCTRFFFAALVSVSGLLCSTAWAIETRPAPQAACPQAVADTLKSWQSLQTWKAFPAPGPGIELWRSPTATIGQWVEVLVLEGSQVELKLLSPGGQQRVRFDERCRSVQSFSKSRQTPGPAEGRVVLSLLSDQLLSDLVNSGKSGVIYLWSPYMQISVLALKEAKQACEQLNLVFVPVILHQDQAEDAIAVAEQAGLSSKALFLQHSQELAFRSLDAHFPSLLLFANKKILDRIYRGYEDTAVYQKYFSDYLKDVSYY